MKEVLLESKEKYESNYVMKDGATSQKSSRMGIKVWNVEKRMFSRKNIKEILTGVK